MKIRVDHKKITSFPLISEESFIDEDISQIENCILYGNNASILVSGYRGSGKTSVINNLKSRINRGKNEDSKYVFVHLDLNKNIEYKMLLRQLIRKLYISVEKYSNFKKDSDVINKLELIYNKTFYDISHSINYKKLLQNSIIFENNIDFKRVLCAFGFFILSTTNIKLDKINISDVVMGLISGLSLAYISSKINITNKLENSNTEDFSSKSLYDDDIAQYELENILDELNKSNIKCIFILDELDKIEDSEEIDKILAELKPLIFSNLATFIIVCGQKLHYKYIEAETKDDPFIASLFTNTLHTPLASRNQLQDMFTNYMIPNEDDRSNELDDGYINKYIDLLIFKSGGILRKFNNEISKNILWEEEKAYLYIDKDSYNLEIESKIVSIIDDIVNSSNDVVDVIKDFLTQQLYIWSKKIRYKLKFTKEEILNIQEYKSKQHLEGYIEEINIWFNRMISYMEDEKLINREEIDGNIVYKMNFDFKVISCDKDLNSKSIFKYDDMINDFIVLINQVIDYGNVLFELMNLDTVNYFGNMLDFLDNNNIVVSESFISYNLEDINSLYESLINNELNEITDKNRLLIKESTHYLKIIRNNILKNIFLYFTSNTMKYDARIENTYNKANLSYYIHYKNENILFKIIYNDSQNKFNNNISKISRYNKISKYNKVINLFIDESELVYEKFLYNSNITPSGRILNYKNKEYSDNVFLYYIPIPRHTPDIRHILSNNYTIILDEVLNSNISVNEVASTV